MCAEQVAEVDGWMAALYCRIQQHDDGDVHRSLSLPSALRPVGGQQNGSSLQFAMASLGVSAVVLCVGLLAAALLSHLVPTLHLPSSSLSPSLLEAAYLGDLSGVQRLLASHINQSLSQQRQHPQRTFDALFRDSRNNTALHVNTHSLTHSLHTCSTLSRTATRSASTSTVLLIHRMSCSLWVAVSVGCEGLSL